MVPPNTQAVVIGAGPAGLACAACLKRKGINPVVLERSRAVGSAWRKHYKRLHLHTNNGFSHLPHLGFPSGVGRWPSREEVVRYLEAYSEYHGIRPQFDCEVRRVTRENGVWRVEHSDGTLVSDHVVIATGYTGEPVVPHWPGDSSFSGAFVHSSQYRDGEPFRGQRVLVIGFGNSGGEIALDLAEHGAQPTLSVRSPVNIIPRQILGIPILTLAIPLTKLPAGLADGLSAPILNIMIGSYKELGLRKREKGPFRQIAEDGRIPLIDIGTVDLIRRGGADVRPGIERFDGRTVHFVDGSSQEFDAVIAATGYRPSFDSFLAEADEVVDDQGVPLRSGRPSQLEGLYFCGFYLSPTGMLREISLEARRIAKSISRKMNGG